MMRVLALLLAACSALANAYGAPRDVVAEAAKLVP
jgi:hypothetical protein